MLHVRSNYKAGAKEIRNSWPPSTQKLGALVEITLLAVFLAVSESLCDGWHLAVSSIIHASKNTTNLANLVSTKTTLLFG